MLRLGLHEGLCTLVVAVVFLLLIFYVPLAGEGVVDAAGTLGYVTFKEPK